MPVWRLAKIKINTPDQLYFPFDKEKNRKGRISAEIWLAGLGPTKDVL
jgi:hypothetical protein